jgi:hypothetical protein
LTVSESAFAPLRRRERQRRNSALRQRLRDTLGPNVCSVWLYSCGEACGYGSLARGDWNGCSDTDLLVVAANQDAAERTADQLWKSWWVMTCCRSIKSAGRRWPAPPRPTGGRSAPRRFASIRSHEPGAGDGLAEQVITTATAVLAWVERLDQGDG